MTRIDTSNVKLAQQGEAYSWPVVFSGVQASDLITKMYLTLKAYPEGLGVADPGALQKALSTSFVSGVGQITNTGAAGKCLARFDFTASQMAALGQRDYYFDIKAISAGGLPYYVESGIFRVGAGVTISNT